MLTKFDINVIIKTLNFPICKKEIEFELEVCAEKARNAPNLQGKPYDACLKNDRMTEVHASLEEAVYYFVQLFYKTGQRYSCSRTKLGKLLSIVAFVYAQKNEKLFDDIIYKYVDCGTVIKNLVLYVDNEVYIRYEYHDKKDDIDISLIDENADFPEKYAKTDSLSQDLKNTIKNIFVKFGAFAAKDLGLCINPIVVFNDITLPDGSIDLSKIHSLTKECFNNDPSIDTTLIDFLFDVNSSNGDTNNDKCQPNT